MPTFRESIARYLRFRSQLSTRSARIFSYVFTLGLATELYLMAIWGHHGAGPTHDQRIAIYAITIFIILYTLYQMFIVQEIPFYWKIDWINHPASTKQVQFGWRAMLAGVLYLAAASIVPLMLLSVGRG